MCVLFTACSALFSGFIMIILTDCVATSHMDVHEQALQIIEIVPGRLMSQQDFLALLASA